VTVIAFVTGAAGMLGAALCRRLAAAGCDVRAFDRVPVEHPLLRGVRLEAIRGDILDPGALVAAMQGCTHVFHVAGVVSYRVADAPLLHAVNVRGTANVLEAARRAGIKRLVHTSSTAAVGLQGPLDEDAPFPGSCRRVPYMATKRAGEELALACDDLEVVVVNPATVYGAGDMKMHTGKMFRRLRRGQMRICPPGSSSVVSVSDCVEGHLSAMEKGAPRRRYILSSEDHSYARIFAEIADAVGGKAPRWTWPKAAKIPLYGIASLLDVVGRWVPMDVSRHVVGVDFSDRIFRSDRARAELGWRPTQDLHSMIGEAAAFYAAEGLMD
jgi:dihydroflavonol-4-reductase